MTRSQAATLFALIQQFLPVEWELDRAVLPEFKAQRDGDGALFGIVVRVKRRGRGGPGPRLPGAVRHPGAGGSDSCGSRVKMVRREW